MAKTISNSDDVIDSRDVIERIEELEGELQIEHDGAGNELSFDDWLIDVADPEDGDVNGGAAELLVLRKLAEEGEGSPDWAYGEALIRETYFRDYAQELAEDCGMIPDNLSWPCTCIDWEQAARELQMDYFAVDFDGVTYYIRG